MVRGMVCVRARNFLRAKKVLWDDYDTYARHQNLCFEKRPNFCQMARVCVKMWHRLGLLLIFTQLHNRMKTRNARARAKFFLIFRWYFIMLLSPVSIIFVA